jgi:hypothetical protein
LPSFSPFSPEFNAAMNDRGSLGAASTVGGNEASVPRTLSSYGQRFGGSNGNVRLSPVNSSGSARSPTPSQTPQDPQAPQSFARSSFGFTLNRAAPPFQLNRAPSRPGVSGVTLPTVGPRPSSVVGQHMKTEEGMTSPEVNGGLNGIPNSESISGAGMDTSVSSTSIATSASLTSPGQKSDSSGSVQFRLSMNSPGNSPTL